MRDAAVIKAFLAFGADRAEEHLTAIAALGQISRHMNLWLVHETYHDSRVLRWRCRLPTPIINLLSVDWEKKWRLWR